MATTIGSKPSTSPRVTIVQKPDRFPPSDPSVPKKHTQSPFSSPKKIHPSLEGTVANPEKTVQKQSWHISKVPRHGPSVAASKSTEKQSEKLSSKNSDASLASQSDINLTNKQAETKVEAQPTNDLPAKSVICFSCCSEFFLAEHPRRSVHLHRLSPKFCGHVSLEPFCSLLRLF